MTFKSDVVKLVDRLDRSAKKIGAVNTILNKNGLLIGYNTDAMATESLIKKIKLNKDEKILVLGAGGVAKAIIYSLDSIGFKNIYVANKTYQKINHLNQICKIRLLKCKS